MAGQVRTQAARRALEARARALRAGGAAMAEIEAETGVPVSTLYQWAARGKWRLGDLESETPAKPVWAQSRGLVPEDETGPGSSPGNSDISATPDALRSAGEDAMARALVLASDGRARAAREALLLGQRFVRAAEVLAGAGAGTGAQVAAPAVTDPGDDPRAELERRLRGLVRHAFDQDERAQDQTGLEDVRGLDLTPFALPGGGWRKATQEEKARIAAGDWAPGISGVQYLVIRYLHPERWGGKRGEIPDWYTGVHKPVDIAKLEACVAALHGGAEAPDGEAGGAD